MIFHLGCELPVRPRPVLDDESPSLNLYEIGILRDQIRKNSRVINRYIERLDLLVNKERYPQDASFLARIRQRLEVLMDENNTFRSVLWKHDQQQPRQHPERE